MTIQKTELDDAIAVIGISCRFPGASDCQQYWHNLKNGLETTTRFSADELLSAGIPETLVNDPNYVPVNGVIDDIDRFDADFFGLTPKEAGLTDPQHRLFLECSHQALSSAGYDSHSYPGQIAVFAGSGPSSYLIHNIMNNQKTIDNANAFQLYIGNTQDFVATRTAYKLNLSGPAMSVGTACSTSLVAVHMGCQALLDYQSDMALVGGVSIQLPQIRGYLYEDSGILSPDGHCRAFDEKAAGTVNGNGVGVVLLKRYEDALADGDTIRAIIRGSAVNNDGSAKVGFTAPSVDGQVKVVTEALLSSGLEPDDIQYIETHGTATPLGDSIEIKALTSVFSSTLTKGDFCALGSVKTNFGHLDAAAGIAGLIKVILALENKQIPPSLHFDQANPNLKLAESPFYVNAKLQNWESSDHVRYAAVSSFGIGGTNAHVVIQEAPLTEAMALSDIKQELIVLSANTSTALKKSIDLLRDHLKDNSRQSLHDCAYTLAVGRKGFAYRAAWLASDNEHLIQQLASETEFPQKSLASAKIVFMFPGQGAQSIAMAAGLHHVEEDFRYWIEHCLDLLEPKFLIEVRALLLGFEQTSHSHLDQQTMWVQPALFIMEYALAKLWIGKGVKPDVLIGHSIGEYVASCLSGVLTLQAALKLVCHRAELMQSAPTGEMLVVPLAQDQISHLLTADVSLAAVNTANQSVLSGDAEALKQIVNQLEGCIKLNTSHAFHSHLMEPILAQFATVLSDLRPGPITIPYLSNLTGNYITDDDLSDTDYWVKHLRSPVRFFQSVQLLLNDNQPIFVELGPGKTLSSMVQQIQAQSSETNKNQSRVIPGLRLGSQPEPADAYLMDRLAKAWVAGLNIEWSDYFSKDAGHYRRIQLPTYPFDRQSYWIEPDKSINQHITAIDDQIHGTISSEDRLPLSDWFYTPSWKRIMGLHSPQINDNWLLIRNGYQLSSALIDALKANGSVNIIDNVEAVADTLDRLKDHLQEKSFCVVYWLRSSEDYSIDKAQQDYFDILKLTVLLSQLEIELSINLISSPLFSINAEEKLQLNYALSLGNAKVITQEYPLLHCRLIDSDQHAPAILARVLSLPRESVGATIPLSIRGATVWQQYYEKLAYHCDNNSLVQNGVYLISGGLGGVGMILAEYLARKYQARLVLLSRSSIDYGQSDSAAIDNSSVSTKFEQILSREDNDLLLDQLVDQLNIYPLQIGNELEQRLNSLCAAYIAGFFCQCGFEFIQGQTFTLKNLENQLAILPAFKPFVSWFVQVLVEDGYLLCANSEHYTINRSKDELADSEQLYLSLLQDYNSFRGTIELLNHCVAGYFSGLRGEVPAISILYPQGKAELLENAGEHTYPHSLREAQMELLRAKIVALAEQKSEGTLRILEVGVGDGILASKIVPALQHLNVEYTATDLGPMFVEKIRQNAQNSGYDFCRFATLDISQDPEKQGFEAGYYDLVLGLDVVHATENIQQTLSNLNRLLAADGSIALIEAILERRWITMIWGLAEGWWCFGDKRVQGHSPLLSTQHWTNELIASGFDSVDCITGQDSDSADYGLIIGHKYPVTNAEQHLYKRLKRIEASGAELMLAAADVADREQMQSVGRQIEARFGQLDGIIHAAGITNREAIFNLIGETTEATAKSVFYPKLHGTLALQELADKFNPGFCLLISSNASTLGGVGLSAYSAASCWLDAYAHSQQQAGSSTRWISSNWDGWPTEETTGLDSEFKTRIDRYKMNVDESEQAFEAVLGSGVAQVIVSAGSLSSRIKLIESTPEDRFKELETSNQIDFPDQNIFTEQTEEIIWNSPTEKYLAGLWKTLLGVAHVLPEDDFFDLHGDSLIATQMIAKINKDKNLNIPFHLLFERTRLKELSQAVDELLQMRGDNSSTNEKYITPSLPEAEHNIDDKEEGYI